MQEHVGTWLKSSRVLARHNVLSEQELRLRWDAIDSAGLGEEAADECRWKQLHWFEVEAEATDPRWLKHLDVGMVFDTTADSWLDDPCSAAG